MYPPNESAPAPTAVASAVRELLDVVDGIALPEALAVYAAVDGVVEAARSRRLAVAMDAAEAAGQDPHKVAAAAAGLGGKCSRRAAELASKRARAVRANDALGDRLASGDLSPGQVDNIAHAMDTDASAATDQKLTAQIAERSVDQGRRIANDWITEKTSANDLEAKHQRQRKNRCAQKYWSASRDAIALTLYGDGPTIDRLWHQIGAQERIEYRNDGGRDVPISDHPRTRDQRRFDAAVALLLGTAQAGTSRPAAVITIPWSKLTGDTDSCAEQIGYGPIPDSTVLDALATADLLVNITGLHGQTLWWGRTRRAADRNQFISLVARDKGCVLCGSQWQTCESHHLMPSKPPGKGDTDINNLALVCSSCHHRLHDSQLTLYQNPESGQWLTRPARPDEIAPRRPNRKSTSKRKPDRKPTRSRGPTHSRSAARSPG